MNGIFGMGELLMDTKLSTEQSEFAEAIINCAHSVLCIVNDILDFSKIEAGKLGTHSPSWRVVLERDTHSRLSA
jgi:signal transduction histidine kinase